MAQPSTVASDRAELRETAAYVIPFVCFIGFLALGKAVPIVPGLRFLTLLAILLALSRRVLPRGFERPGASVLLGIAVFAIWVGPDIFFPHYRGFWLFSNNFMGQPVSSLDASQRSNLLLLLFRVAETVVTIPILEELFWRGWLMRWLIARDFTRIPLGAYQAAPFWIVAVLFASEHGPFWEVGLAAGAIYNWWIVRTRSLNDCILAHAVTNACLAAFVIGRGQWQYWL